jgi:hypothetical protein
VEVIAVFQQGQAFEFKPSGGHARWAYRYRVGGRGSRRVQRGGYASEQAATEALERALLRLRREGRLVEAPTLSELVELYLGQHCGEPETVAKLRWLLAKALLVFGHRRINQLQPAEIAAWRMTIPVGHRFEATQALRQVLARAVSWGMIDLNPAKQGIENPQRRRTEKRPFESWDELRAVATELDRVSARLSSLPRQRACARASGSHSSSVTSTMTSASCTSGAHGGTAASSVRKVRRASALSSIALPSPSAAQSPAGPLETAVSPTGSWTGWAPTATAARTWLVCGSSCSRWVSVATQSDFASAVMAPPSSMKPSLFGIGVPLLAPIEQGCDADRR